MVRNLRITLYIMIIASLLVGVGLPEVLAASPDMVLVQGGSYLMGETAGLARSSEKPVREVRVRSFYIGRYEITFEEYDAFCLDTGRPFLNDRGWGRGRQPALDVPWQEAVAYCNWLSQREGLMPVYYGDGNDTICYFGGNGYRLPTEAEWEYAAKGGLHSQEYRYSGSNDVNLVGWHAENSGRRTHPVGQKQPNELELYDMSGNVSEWCWDWYAKDYYTQGEDDNPTGPGTGKFRVIRGGDKNSYTWLLRSSSRLDYSISSVITNIGFRVVRNTK